MSHTHSSVLTGFRREDNANSAFLSSGFSPGAFRQGRAAVFVGAFGKGKLLLIASVTPVLFGYGRPLTSVSEE